METIATMASDSSPPVASTSNASSLPVAGPSTPPSSPPAPSQPTYLDAIKTISPLEDLQRLPQIPCARYSLLFGIVAGVSIGTVRFLFSTTRGRVAGGGMRWDNVMTATNWAVGAWGVGSLGAWETCRRRQTAEVARMNALVADLQARRAGKLGDRPPRRGSAAKAPPPPSPGGAAAGTQGGGATATAGEVQKEGSSKLWWRIWG